LLLLMVLLHDVVLRCRTVYGATGLPGDSARQKSRPYIIL